jgi:hypothetical protein
MEEDIKKAIELLERNNYFVKKISDKMNEDADACAEQGCGDCMYCSCFICAAGIE